MSGLRLVDNSPELPDGVTELLWRERTPDEIIVLMSVADGRVVLAVNNPIDPPRGHGQYAAAHVTRADLEALLAAYPEDAA